MIAKSKITRRGFIKASAALTASFVAIPAAANKAASPKRGGILRIGISGGSVNDSLDPALYSSGMMINIAKQYAGYLVEIDNDGKLQPELAISWENDVLSKKWHFSLRRGVLFHNGKELDADDVVYSISYHAAKDSKSGARILLNNIDRIVSNGKYKITFDLKNADSGFPYILSDYHLVIIPSGLHPSSGIGTGAYQIENFEPGIRCLAKRNSNYWRADRAFFNEVETISINDPSTRISALQFGKVDIIDKVSTSVVDLLKKDRRVKLLLSKSHRYHAMPMHGNVDPFSDLNFVKALKYATDREDILNRIFKGYGSVANDVPVHQDNKFFNRSLTREYDLDKAKFYLKKSDFSGFVTLYTSRGISQEALDLAVLFKEQMSKANINIEISKQPSNNYWGSIWLKKPFCVSLWASRPLLDIVFSLSYHSKAPWNESKFSSKEFDSLLADIKLKNSSDQRKIVYNKLQEIIYNEGTTIIPAFNNTIDASRSNIYGFRPHYMDELSNHRAAELLWRL